MDKRQFLQIAKALADRRRLEILEHVASAGNEIPCGEVRARISISRATMSHHIKELEAAGLIQTRRAAKYMFLQMSRKTWSEYLKRLGKIAP